MICQFLKEIIKLEIKEPKGDSVRNGELQLVEFQNRIFVSAQVLTTLFETNNLRY